MNQRWTTGFNMPGYMPDPDAVAVHETWEEARASLSETIESHMDHDGMDSRKDVVWNQQVNARDFLRNAVHDLGLCVTAGQFVYWIEPVEQKPVRVLRVPGALGDAVEEFIKLDCWLAEKPAWAYLSDRAYDGFMESQMDRLQEGVDKAGPDADARVLEVKAMIESCDWIPGTIDDPLDAKYGVIEFCHDDGRTVHVVGVNHQTDYGK